MPLALLARLKILRGTPIDPFGYSAERRAERALITWYEGVIERMRGSLDAAHLTDLIAIARAPLEIRGYGPVKDTAIARVKPEVERLLVELGEPSPAKLRGRG
jgi:indolepyruvate ferredoxin oxidoreductase